MRIKLHSRTTVVFIFSKKTKKSKIEQNASGRNTFIDINLDTIIQLGQKHHNDIALPPHSHP